MEFATSTLHNGFQFHKSDNVPYDRLRVARHIEGLITEQLKTWDVKTWFRAYLNLGLIARALGHDRILRCTAATTRLQQLGFKPAFALEDGLRETIRWFDTAAPPR